MPTLTMTMKVEYESDYIICQNQECLGKQLENINKENPQYQRRKG